MAVVRIQFASGREIESFASALESLESADLRRGVREVRRARDRHGLVAELTASEARAAYGVAERMIPSAALLAEDAFERVEATEAWDAERRAYVLGVGERTRERLRGVEGGLPNMRPRL